MPVPTRREFARVLARVPSVCVTAVFVADAMLVIEEHEPDRYGADDECEHRSEAYAGGGGLGVDVRHTLNGGDVQEDPAAKGKQHALRALAHVTRKDGNHAKDNRDARGKIESERGHGSKPPLPREDHVVRELVRDLMRNRRDRHREGLGAAAILKGGTDKDAVHKVVHKIAKEDAGADAYGVDFLLAWVDLRVMPVATPEAAAARAAVLVPSASPSPASP